MSSQGAKQLMSADWSYHIYIMPWFLIHTKICVLVNEKGGGDSWKIFESVILEGEGFKKMSFCTNIFFEWPLILEITIFWIFKVNRTMRETSSRISFWPITVFSEFWIKFRNCWDDPNDFIDTRLKKDSYVYWCMLV